MLLNPQNTVAPPLRLLWKSGVQLKTAVAGANALYGVTTNGRIVALDSTTGAVRWESTGTYVHTRLALQGRRLFAYRLNEGLCFIDDAGSTATERLVASFGVSDSVYLSTPVVDGQLFYFVVNQGLYCIHQENGLQFGSILSESVPHAVGVVSPGEIIVLDGDSVPTRYRVAAQGFELVWRGQAHGVRTGQTEAQYVVVGNRLIVSAARDIIAYDLTNGRIAWRLADRGAQKFAVHNGVVYGAFYGATVRAIRPETGALLWERQYVYDASQHEEYGIVSLGGHVYLGALHSANADRGILYSLRSNDGDLSWISRAAANPWAAGLPTTNGNQLFCHGLAETAAYGSLEDTPAVTVRHIAVTPRPLRGDSSQFGSGSISVTLPVAARVSIAVHREREGLGANLVTSANWAAGGHEVAWSPGGAGGFTAENQFGFILVDIEQAGRSPYTVPLLMGVNSFPDVIWHWARTNVETMTYHRYVNGYPSQMFLPDNLVTRAESSTIIAKTLGLERPSTGFQSKLTDIRTHWARDYIMALEERGVIGGFAEPDGTFTFRPDLNMTRAQEARILVKAYSVTPAAPGFTSAFRDIAGHWAETDIKALEAAGYVNGFQEPDGSRTYRPEQNLTRAELCTVVVRIRRLSR